MAKNTKQKMSELVTKLGDRDTFTMAARELDLMARQIDPTTGNLQSFISVILSADTGDKPAVRKHCIHLLAVLSLSLPPNALSPFLSKILTRITRRLRDPDSSIRSSCVSAVSAISSRITKPPFASAFMKPLSDTLFTEQEVNAQIGAALCLAAAIDSASDPDPGKLGGVLLPRLEKLVKCNAFKAKSAGVVVIGSVIGAGGVSLLRGGGGLKGLVDCLVGLLVCDDWAARKAAAEALGKLAVMERDGLGEFKAKCLKIFENRKYDKVKAVREVMNQMIEAWKQVPDLAEEVSPPRSNASSKGVGGDEASDGRYPSGSRVASTTPGKSRTHLVNRPTPPGSSLAMTARKRADMKSNAQKKTGSVPSHTKSNVRRRLDWKAGGGANIVPISEPLEEEDHAHNENAREESHSNDERLQKLGGVASSLTSNISLSSAVMASGHHVLSENQNSRNCKGFEDVSLIRNQLVQIEQQQSNLMELLQRFVGSSQHGMRGLETRVHGLELALDEISYDLAVANGRMSNNSSGCCLLPPASFITSKFWKKSDSKHSAPRLSAYSNRSAQTTGIHDSRQRFNGTPGFIVNPLAEIRPDNGTTGMPLS